MKFIARIANAFASIVHNATQAAIANAIQGEQNEQLAVARREVERLASELSVSQGATRRSVDSDRKHFADLQEARSRIAQLEEWIKLRTGEDAPKKTDALSPVNRPSVAS
jgi:outer membrane protein TolC